MRTFATIAFALSLLALVLPSPAAAQISLFGSVRNSMVQFLLNQISTEGFEVTAEGIETPEDGLMELVGVRIADTRGVWLEVDAVGLDWNASRILRGELEIRRLTGRGVRVLRLPEPVEGAAEDAVEDVAEDAEGGFSWPRAPITTRIESLSLTDIFVAETVVGPQSIRFDATGEARDEGDEQALQLLIQRTDDVTGRIALAYLRDFAADTLSFDLNAREGAGGAVAALAGLPADTPVRANVQAIGPLDDWQMSLSAQAEDQFLLEGDATLSVGPPLAIDATVALVPGAEIDPQLAAVLGDEATLIARIEEQAGGLILIERGSLEAPDVDLTVAGSFARESGQIDTTATLEVRGGLAALVDGVAWERVGFDGTVIGTFSNLEATGRLALDGLQTDPADIGSASLEGTVTLDDGRIAAAVAGTAEALRLDRIGPELLGQVDLSADVVYDDGLVTLDGLSLNAPLLTAEATGEADLNASQASLRYALGTPDLAPIAAVYDVDAGAALNMEGRLEGPIAAPTLTGTVAANGLRYADTDYGRLALEHAVTLGEAIEGTLELVSTGSPFGEAEIATGFGLAAPTLTVSDLSAQVLGVEAAGEAVVDLETTLTEGALSLRIADLDALAAYAEAPVTGAASGDLVLSVEDGVQQATFDGVAESITGPDVRLDRALIDVTLRDPTGTLSVDGRVDIAMLEALGVQVGALTFDGSGRDLLAAPAVDASLTAADVEAAGVRIGSVALNGTGTDLLSAPTVDATVAATDIATAGVTVADLDGAVDIAVADGLPTGTGALDLRSIDTGAASIPTAAVAFDLRAEADALIAELDGDVPRVDLADGTIGPVSADARVTDALGPDPAIEADLSLGRVAVGPVSLSRADVTASGTRSALSVDLRADGTVGEAPVAAAIDTVIDAADPATVVVRLDRSDLTYDELAIGLRSPATVTVGETVALDRLDLVLPGGGLVASGRQEDGGIVAAIDLSLDDLLPLAEIADLPLRAGSLALDANLDTTAGRAAADTRFAAIGMAFDGAVSDAGTLDIEGEGRWNGRRLDAALELGGPHNRPVTATIGLPVSRDEGGLPVLNQRGALDGTLRWQGRIGDLWVLVPAPDHVLDGDLLVDLSIGGTLASPTVGGDVALTNGQYQNLLLGTILTQLTVQSTIEPDGSFGLDLTADDGSGGTVTADVEIGDGELSANLGADGAILVRRDDVDAAVSLDIEAQGPLTGPAVSGRVGIDRAEVNLNASFAPSIADIGPYRIKGVEPEPEEEGVGASIPLDIRIEGPGDIFVRGRGLDSEWRIDLTVGGTAAAPEVVGVIERIRGALNLVGFTFDLDTGEIRFTGGQPVDPTLDIRILRENEGVVGGIYVDGTASDPNVEFRSVPELPQDEVLPRVLFGASQQSLTGTQALLIAGGVAELMGNSGLLSGVQSATGLDVMRFEDDGEGGADLTVGSNVADGVFVGAKQPVGGGQTRVTVEVEVFDDVIVDSEVSGEDSSIGLRWRREF